MYVVWTRPKTSEPGGRQAPQFESDLECDSSTATIWTNYGGNVTTDANITDTEDELPDRYRRDGSSDW